MGDKHSGRVWCGSESIGRSCQWRAGAGPRRPAAGLHVTSHQRAPLPGFEAAEAGAVLWPARGRAGRPLPRWDKRGGAVGGERKRGAVSSESVAALAVR